MFFKSNVPRRQDVLQIFRLWICFPFPLSSHEPPVVEDETVLIAVRRRSSPEVELEFACQPRGNSGGGFFWGGKEKDPPTLQETTVLLRFLSLGHSDFHQIQVIALYKNLKKILLGWNSASYSELYSYSDFWIYFLSYHSPSLSLSLSLHRSFP